MDTIEEVFIYTIINWGLPHFWGWSHLFLFQKLVLQSFFWYKREFYEKKDVFKF